MSQQSPGLLLRLVPEPTQVAAVHLVAQLQVGHRQDHHHLAAGRHPRALLLLHARLHRQEDLQRLESPTRHLMKLLAPKHVTTVLTPAPGEPRGHVLVREFRFLRSLPTVRLLMAAPNHCELSWRPGSSVAL